MKQCDKMDRDKQREQIIGLGERSFKKSYYPQLRQNTERLERFKALLDQTSDFVMLVSLPAFEITDVNTATEKLFGKKHESLVGAPLLSLNINDNDLVLVKTALLNDFENNHQGKETEGHLIEIQLEQKNKLTWLELSYKIARLDSGYYAVLVGRDITEQKHYRDLLEKLLAEKEALLDNALVGIAWVHKRTIVTCNKRLEDILGHAPGSIIGKSTRILYESDETFNNFGNEAYKALDSGQQFTGTLQLKRVDGTLLWCELTGKSVNPNEPESDSIWMFSDVTEHMLSQEKAVFLSHHDSLTQLPNHLLLEDRLNQAIVAAKTTGGVVGLISLDIDRFKTVNDLLGYHDSNQLLILVSEQLSSFLGQYGTLFRQGGDEFQVLLPDLVSIDSSFPILRQLLLAFEQKYFIAQHEVPLTSSLGIAFFPQDDKTFDGLLNKANMAMYDAKQAGGNTYRFYSPAMNQVANEKLNIAFGLQKALETNQLEVHYQPQVDIVTGQFIGAEALLRWNHPDFGLISPGKFIPIAEDTGLIVPIGEWVLKEACRTAAMWRKAGIDNATIAVNLSAVQFDKGNIETSVRNAITMSGIYPEMLELELTESILISDTEKVLEKVSVLKLMGCKLSIDDFGTGYSSLSYLKRFSVDKLKIDQMFIKELTDNQDDAVIVRAIIHMAKSLGLKTIAEGIESNDVLQLLKLYQCDEAQGYFIGRPMKLEKLDAFIKNRTH